MSSPTHPCQAAEQARRAGSLATAGRQRGSPASTWRAFALLCLLCAVVLAVLPLRAAAAGPLGAAATDVAGSCTLVFGHGRHPSDDEAANRSWDEANRAMASQVATDLAASGRRIVRLLLPVTVTDVPAIVEGVLQRALQQGCGRIVESNLFVDDDADVIVARLRAYAVEPAGGAGRPARIGATLYNHQQQYPHTQRHLERLVPATLGRELAADYLQRQGPR